LHIKWVFGETLPRFVCKKEKVISTNCPMKNRTGANVGNRKRKSKQFEVILLTEVADLKGNTYQFLINGVIHCPINQNIYPGL
jgi:hypothetical protein